ncbi:MAG: PIG-L family deacetylase [Bacteroidales bacterium]|nr:PIG-L family deacetylase [Bacteroidales bacterium]
MDRRNMIKRAGTALAGLSIFGVDAFAAEKSAEMTDNGKLSASKKVVIVGAHPDDPESMFGGTMLLFKAAGCDVVSVYMTKGEAGIPGKTHDEAAKIREQEAREACRIMGVRPIFMTQIDGNSEINKERYAEMKAVLAEEKPDIVFTHWPIDSHPDHRVCASLVYDAWRRLGYSFDLYYGEAMTGLQSQCFHPSHYLDITEFSELKRKATFCHVSQKPEEWYDEWHLEMEKFRGKEHGCKNAEAFVLLSRGRNDIE